MPLGRRPVETFFKRSAYKTEFDIFKKSSQLDLISLLSFEDTDDGATLKTAKNSQNKSRPLYEKASTARATTTRRSAYNNNRDFVRSRAWIEYKRQGIEQPFRRGNTESSRRTCKSAFGSTTSSKTSEVYRGARLRSKSTYCRRSNVERNDGSLTTVHKSTPLKQADIKGEPKQSVNGQRSLKTPDVSDKLTNNSDKKTRINTAISVRTVRSDNSAGNVEEVNDKSDTRRPSLKTTGKYTNTAHSCGRRYSEGCNSSHTGRPKSSISSRAGPGDSEIEDVCTSVVSELGSLQRADEHVDSDSEPSWVSGDYKGIRSPDDFVTDAADAAVSDENDNLASRDSGFCSKTTSPDTKHHNIVFDEESALYIQSNERRCVKFDIDKFDVSSGEDTSDDEGVEEVPDADVTSKGVKDYADFIHDLSELENGANIFDHKLANSEADDHESGGIESLCSEVPCHSETCREENDSDSASNLDDQTSRDIPTSGITDRKMSNEARHAIFETLQDMRLTGKRDRKSSAGADMSLHQGVTAKRRLNNNRQQYKYYLRERTNTMIRNKPMDVDETHDTDYRRHEIDDADTASTSIELRNLEDLSYAQGRAHGPLLPSIGGHGKVAHKSDSASSHPNVYTLDHVKKRKYKIPGIGNYNLVTSPDQEFEITPAGFDSRYNVGTAISEVEREPPPKFIQDQSINKCKKWLKNVSLAPLALKPAKPSKVSTRK